MQKSAFGLGEPGWVNRVPTLPRWDTSADGFTSVEIIKRWCIEALSVLAM